MVAQVARESHGVWRSEGYIPGKGGYVGKILHNWGRLEELSVDLTKPPAPPPLRWRSLAYRTSDEISGPVRGDLRKKVLCVRILVPYEVRITEAASRYVIKGPLTPPPLTVESLICIENRSVSPTRSVAVLPYVLRTYGTYCNAVIHPSVPSGCGAVSNQADEKHMIRQEIRNRYLTIRSDVYRHLCLVVRAYDLQVGRRSWRTPFPTYQPRGKRGTVELSLS